MLKELFTKQKQYIDFFFEKIDLKKGQEILETLLSCKGNIIFSGVGKSGIIAQKLAMTFLSTGSKAFYLPPSNALHGDIGLIDEKDLLIVLSKSGQTQELIHLIPYVRRKGVKVMAWVSKEKSQLEKMADITMLLPLQKELCPFDLAPTTSTATQLLFGDILVSALMEKKKFSLQDYMLNHPSGSIGKKISLLVEDLMVKGEDLPVCGREEKLVHLLAKLSQKRCGCLLVVDDNKELLGIFTDGDLRRALEKQGIESLEKPMSALMTKEAKSTSCDVLAWKAMEQMEEDPNKLIMVLPVLKEKKLVGLIRMHDILQSGL